MELSFSELRAKAVVNLTDGRKLGHTIDLIFNQKDARILGIIVPGTRSGFLRSREDIFIPYNCIVKIGLDTILVELSPLISTQNQHNYAVANPLSQTQSKNNYTIATPVAQDNINVQNLLPSEVKKNRI